MKRRDLFIVMAVFLFAFIIRVIFLSQINNTPFFTILSTDDTYYDSWAQEIAQGTAGSKVFYGLPLYPYVLGFIYSIFGHNLFVARLFQALFDSFGCVLLYLIGKNVFNRAIGIIASLMFAFYNMSIYFSGFLCSTPLATMLSLLILLLLLSTLERSRPMKWVLLGILIGITSLASPSIILFIPFMIIWMFVTLKKIKRRDLLMDTAFMLMAFLAIISIATIKNYITEKDFVPITAHSGITFYAGNNSDAIGSFCLPYYLGRGVENTRITSKRIAEQAAGRILKPSEVSAFWFNKGMKFIVDNPRTYIKLLFRKMYLFWWVKEIPETIPLKFVRQYSPILKFPLFGYALISPLALVGLIMAFGRKSGRLLLMYMFVGSIIILLIIYFVSSRYRMAAGPILILFASFTLYSCYEKIRKGQYIFVAAILTVVCLLFTIFNTDFIRFSEEATYNILGISYALKNQPDKAETIFKYAIEINRLNPISYYDLGVLYFFQNRYAESILMFQEALRLNPNCVDAHNDLGTIYNVLGDREKAIEHFKASLELNPDQINIKAALDKLRA